MDVKVIHSQISAVEVSRTIKVGCNYRIHPSQGWQGIIEGDVTVRNICHRTEDNTVQMLSDVQLNAQYYDTYYNNNRSAGDYEDMMECRDGLWVLAEYKTNIPDGEDKILVMDIDLFSSHVTCC